MEEDPTTQELRLEQLKREQEERERAEEGVTPDDTEQHERRAEKATYLREKLERRAEAEREAARDDDAKTTTTGDAMEHDERADELEKEAERLEHESKRLAEDTREARTEWEAARSDTAQPGAQDEEGAGPHNIDTEDPASGEKYGEERQAELDDAREADSEGG